jgi:hypothetical protein
VPVASERSCFKKAAVAAAASSRASRVSTLACACASAKYPTPQLQPPP